jgi:hypothetical protein
MIMSIDKTQPRIRGSNPDRLTKCAICKKKVKSLWEHFRAEHPYQFDLMFEA